MAVLLPNAQLGVRRRNDAVARNARGERIPAGWGSLIGFHEGRINEKADGSWALGVDPELWPVRKDDLIVSSTGMAWLVTTSDLIQNNFDHRVDWVRVTGQHRGGGGTEPGGAWFVARYAPVVDPSDGDVEAPPIQTESGLWIGYGPPPGFDFGAEEGEEYLDLITGTIYEMRLDS